jgi:hypothetical protein
MRSDLISKHLNQETIDFVKYSGLNIIYKGGELEFILKNNLKNPDIKNYFKTTGEKSKNYKGKIFSGELYLNKNQIQRYVSKKRMN